VVVAIFLVARCDRVGPAIFAFGTACRERMARPKSEKRIEIVAILGLWRFVRHISLYG